MLKHAVWLASFKFNVLVQDRNMKIDIEPHVFKLMQTRLKHAKSASSNWNGKIVKDKSYLVRFKVNKMTKSNWELFEII